jgi:hypothetical protein
MNTCRLPVFALARTAYGKAPNTRTARLVAMLREQRTEGAKLDPAIAANLKELGYGG